MVKNININLASVKFFFGNLTKNLRWLFFAVFLIMLLLEVFQLKNSFSVVSGVNQAAPVVGHEKQVRINFDAYNLAVDRIQQAAAFQPTGGITSNPFATPIVQQPTQ
jgi:hypothetical protein